MFGSTWLKDMFERAVSTFAQSAIGFYILAGPGDLFNVTVLEGAAAAGLIAGLSVVKSALAANVGQEGSASLSPDLKTVDVTNPNEGA